MLDLKWTQEVRVKQGVTTCGEILSLLEVSVSEKLGSPRSRIHAKIVNGDHCEKLSGKGWEADFIKTYKTEYRCNE